MRAVVRAVAALLLTTLLSCSVVVVLAKEKPELTVGVLLRPNTENVHIDDGTNSSTGGGMLVPGIFEPVAKWTHGGRVLGCDLAAGVDLKAGFNEKITYSVFGRIKRSLLWGWNFKARLDTASDHLQSIDTYFHLEGGPTNTWWTVRGNVARDLSSGRVTAMSISQPLPERLAGATAEIFTTHNFDAQKTDLVVACGLPGDRTVVTLGADSNNLQQVSVLQRLGRRHEVTPTLTSKGGMELEYRCAILGSNSTSSGVASTIYQPDRALTFKYEQWPWVTEAVIPLRSYYKVQKAGARFSIRRSLRSFA